MRLGFPEICCVECGNFSLVLETLDGQWCCLCGPSLDVREPRPVLVVALVIQAYVHMPSKRKSNLRINKLEIYEKNH